jgi:MFS family permease
VVYQQRWDFSAITLTSVFAVYALALLAALLVAGSHSDHLGRRPVIVAGLVLEILAMVAFVGATEVEWLFVARVLQGIATGVAMGAITAALLDLQPPERPWLGALVGVVAPMAGLSLGAVVTGALVDLGPAPTVLVYSLLIAAFVVAVPAVLAVPETVVPDGEWRASLRPRVGVPPHARSAFLRALPSLTATWALGGLVLSLGPSLTAEVLGERSHLLGSLPIFLMAGISAITAPRVHHLSPRFTARAGLGALIVGVGIALAALAVGSNTGFLVGTAICGLGFGPAFAAVFGVITDMAPPERRGELVSSVLTVAYVAFSVPAAAAGVAVTQFGLRDTAEVYGTVLIALAAMALLLSGELDGADGADDELRPHLSEPVAVGADADARCGI